MLRQLWARFGADVKFTALAFAAFMGFQTAAYGMYYIPSESMLPTLAVGDRIIVNKFAYGYSRASLPLGLGPELPTADGRIFSHLPKRGDIVVFRHPKTGAVTIKRVIGLPGDEIALSGGQVFLNGALVPTTDEGTVRYKQYRAPAVTVTRLSEDLPGPGGGRHEIYDRGPDHFGDDVDPLLVPAGALFVMGDNRDDSLDSRFGGEGVGFLPLDRLIGRAEIVAFSLNFCRKTETTTCLNRRWGARL